MFYVVRRHGCEGEWNGTDLYADSLDDAKRLADEHARERQEHDGWNRNIGVMNDAGEIVYRAR